MLKKTIVILTSLVILICSIVCFPVISSAQEVTYYASIPRPVPSDHVKYVVSFNPSSGGIPSLYMICLPDILDPDTFILEFNVNDIGELELNLYTSVGIDTIYVYRFDLTGKYLSTSSFSCRPLVITRLMLFSTPALQIDTFDIPILDYADRFERSIPRIAWSETVDPSVYTNWLSNIYNLLSENILSNQNQTDEIVSNQNQNTDDIINNQSQNTQDIIDNQNQLQENEKNEADSSGNDSVNSIVGGIENKGEGFFASMGNLISVMSYNGTDCKWNLPPITLPKIDGVMESITLTDNLEIDFEYWIAQIPSTIMRVVQAISTIALILFCVKELYSILSYVFTLRGG